MNSIKVSTKTVNPAQLKLNPFLEKYGLHKISDFEVKQFLRLNLPPGHILITAENSVLYNWEAIELAKKMKLKVVEVTVIEGMHDDEIPQIVCLKNMRRKLTRYQQAELIIELRDYLENTVAGEIFKEELPEGNTTSKIGFLIGYSYGMTNQLERIYKYNADLLKRIDDGELTFVDALAELPKVKSNSEEHKSDDESDDDENGPQLDPSLDTTPQKPKSPSWNFAGESRMIPCEPIAGITITYANGKVVKLDVCDLLANGEVKGTNMENLHYNGGKLMLEDNCEFHVISSTNNKASIQFIAYNIDELAA